MRERSLLIKYVGVELIYFFIPVFRALGIVPAEKTYITWDRAGGERTKIHGPSSTISLARGLV
jgi:hypothetical protein